MSAIRDGRVPVELGGKTLHLLFSLNVIDELQDRVDDLDKLDGIIFGKSIKDLKWLLALAINEGEELEGNAQYTERQIGRMIHPGNLDDVREAMATATVVGRVGAEQPAEEAGEASDDEGN